jgi:Protein of unknown function (DUF3096)
MFSRTEPKRSVCVEAIPLRLPRFPSRTLARQKETPMDVTITNPHIMPVIAIIAGLLILVVPRLLSFIVAVFLLIYGLNGLNLIHHFIR